MSSLDQSSVLTSLPTSRGTGRKVSEWPYPESGLQSNATLEVHPVFYAKLKRDDCYFGKANPTLLSDCRSIFSDISLPDIESGKCNAVVPIQYAEVTKEGAKSTTDTFYRASSKASRTGAQSLEPIHFIGDQDWYEDGVQSVMTIEPREMRGMNLPESLWSKDGWKVYTADEIVHIPRQSRVSTYETMNTDLYGDPSSAQIGEKRRRL